MHFGLGKINHYVEDFRVGINKETDWTYKWTPVIPNSQLIVFAAPSDAFQWDINIFINPSAAMMFIFISTIVVLFAIGVIILYLHFKERKNNDAFSIGNINIL